MAVRIEFQWRVLPNIPEFLEAIKRGDQVPEAGKTFDHFADMHDMVGKYQDIPNSSDRRQHTGQTARRGMVRFW